ncbi:receptor-type tyrosine-protein phosphatase F-like protein [Pitangus sulphuratus]|nr:receptor-type tyrosine-protein phosphatase F-like protein [Pitangus sulphuratus]
MAKFSPCVRNFSGKPTFMKAPEDQIGISGGVASFVCQATGEPKPRITWMKKGKKVSSQRFEVIEFDDGSGSVLRIQPLRVHRDEAIYECTATNSVGEINTSAKLTVLEDNATVGPSEEKVLGEGTEMINILMKNA